MSSPDDPAAREQDFFRAQLTEILDVGCVEGLMPESTEQRRGSVLTTLFNNLGFAEKGRPRRIFGQSLETCAQDGLPANILALMAYILQRADTEGLFRLAGSSSRADALRALLDTAEDFLFEDDARLREAIPSGINVHDAATVLKRYFRELPEPLLMGRLQDFFYAAACSGKDDTAKLAAVSILVCKFLAEPRAAALRQLLAFLNACASRGDKSLMTAENIAKCWAPNLLQSDASAPAPASCPSTPVRATSAPIPISAGASTPASHVPATPGATAAPEGIDYAERERRIAQLLHIMIERHEDVFKIPAHLEKQAEAVRRGEVRAINAGMRARQVDTATYAREAEETTRGELVKLVAGIRANPKYSDRQRRELLNSGSQRSVLDQTQLISVHPFLRAHIEGDNKENASGN